jgi:hypothetical protein
MLTTSKLLERFQVTDGAKFRLKWLTRLAVAAVVVDALERE